jgi:hypothetical protein
VCQKRVAREHVSCPFTLSKSLQGQCPPNQSHTGIQYPSTPTGVSISRYSWCIGNESDTGYCPPFSSYPTFQRSRVDDNDNDEGDDAKEGEGDGDDGDDDDISVFSRTPSPQPMDVDKYDEYVDGPEREVVTVETKIKSSNKGFAMLSKLGWTEGQPLGLSSDGSSRQFCCQLT